MLKSWVKGDIGEFAILEQFLILLNEVGNEKGGGNVIVSNSYCIEVKL